MILLVYLGQTEASYQALNYVKKLDFFELSHWFIWAVNCFFDPFFGQIIQFEQFLGSFTMGDLSKDELELNLTVLGTKLKTDYVFYI